MKRYSSIDFLRGLAIFIMLFLHIISHVLDVDSLMANINNEPLINIVALVILPYLGGLAGFFLMVSAIGNMISMSKYLKKDNSPDNLIVRQVVGGFLLLIFAMLTEGVIGYWGSLGHLFRNLDNPADTNWQVMLYRGYTFETIHTIAWCIIVNGLVQGLLVKIFKNNMRKIILSYVL
ncbi:MAG: heparan-alpha-glucosaminide N-acetyltransferase domain-containing protein, partial [Promethearchaeota archaeon]